MNDQSHMQGEGPIIKLLHTTTPDPSDADLEKEEIDPNSRLMEKPFDPTKINIETKIPSLETLIKRIKSNTVQLNTESYFQKYNDLWDEVKQSLLIESILIRFPLQAFFFDATEDSNWLVVDGLQRLSSIKNFAVKKSLKLTHLEFLPHLEGKGWDDLTDDLHRLIEETQVVIYKIMPGTPTDVKFNIYKRINTGGLILEPQEIRHALFQGRPAEFIAELAISEAFINATNGKIKTHRMLDRYFSNRFLCFYLFGYQNYLSDLDTYMSKAMASIYDKTDDELNKIKEDFCASMNLCHVIFGEEAFRKVYKDNEQLPPVNKAIFDGLSTQIALLNQSERELLKTKKKEFKASFKYLLANDEEFFTSVNSSTGDRNRVINRHSKIENLISFLIHK